MKIFAALFTKRYDKMDKFTRILSVQDISCVGQCSLTVALPILSAGGLETAILPSAVLSTHTGGFKGYTFRDLTEDIPLIEKHWMSEGLRFAALYTGYLGSAKQIEYVKHIAGSVLEENAPLIVDPAMADNGKLYYGFDLAFVEEMKKLVFSADIILPNITEACFLTGMEYREKYDKKYIEGLFKALRAGGAEKIILTGVSYREGYTGVAVADGDKRYYYEHRKIAGGCHGTGDVFASAFTAAFMRGKTLEESAKIAADFTVACIEDTQDKPDHWYGVCFEPVLPLLIKLLEN